jgi:hypothetical protein
LSFSLEEYEALEKIIQSRIAEEKNKLFGVQAQEILKTLNVPDLIATAYRNRKLRIFEEDELARNNMMVAINLLLKELKIDCLNKTEESGFDFHSQTDYYSVECLIRMTYFSNSFELKARFSGDSLAENFSLL